MHVRHRQKKWTREAVWQAISEFMRKHEIETRLPSKRELQRAGRQDLVKAVERIGGQRALAHLSGLSYAEQKPAGYWTRDQLLEEVRQFMEENGIEGRLPSRTELQQAGKTDLRAAIERHGGQRKVAQLLGVRITSPKKHTASQSAAAPKESRRRQRLRLEPWMVPPAQRNQ